MDKIGPMTKKEYLDKMEDAYQKIMMARTILAECDAIVGESRFAHFAPILESVGDEVYDARNEHMKAWAHD